MCQVVKPRGNNKLTTTTRCEMQKRLRAIKCISIRRGRRNRSLRMGRFLLVILARVSCQKKRARKKEKKVIEPLAVRATSSTEVARCSASFALHPSSFIRDPCARVKVDLHHVESRVRLLSRETKSPGPTLGRPT